MRVMVTGGAGYIGSVVTEALLAGGHEVVVLDHLGKGHRDAVPPEVAFVHADLADGARVREALAAHRVEAVVHMAADSLVGESVADPLKYYRGNVGAGVSLLEAMQATGVGRLVFSSTAAVYGDAAPRPIEETDPTVPTSPYGETKLAFERALAWCARAHGLRSVSLRYFNAAGATARCGERHEPETHLVPIVLDVAAGRRAAVEIYGDDYPTRDGTCVRDYIHVVDLARAHVLALEALAAGRPGAVYNLGCGAQGHTVREVLSVAREITGRAIPARVAPRRPGAPAVLVAASGRITADLGWTAVHQDLHAIIGSAWAWRVARGLSGPSP